MDRWISMLVAGLGAFCLWLLLANIAWGGYKHLIVFGEIVITTFQTIFWLFVMDWFVD